MSPGRSVDQQVDASTVPFGHDIRAGAVRRVAAVIEAHLDGLAARSAMEIWHREAEFRERLPGPEALIEPCRVSLGAALRTLRDGDLGDDQARRIRHLGRVASAQGLPLEVVLRGLRVDFLVLWSEMLLVARTTDPSTLQGFINSSEIVWSAVDAVTVEFTLGYRSDQTERARLDAVRREDLLRALLDGTAADRTEVSDLLGLELGGRYVVVVADVTTVEPDEAARCCRYAFLRSAWTSHRGHTVGIVTLGAEGFEAVRDALSTLRRVRAGLSSVADDIALAPDLLRLATLTLRSMSARESGVASPFDRPGAILASADPWLSLTLVNEVLAPLLARPARERATLLETLTALDEAGGSVVRAGELLFCHRNTVLNRLAKIARLTGLDFEAPSDLLLVAVVAHLVRSHAVGGGSVLDD